MAPPPATTPQDTAAALPGGIPRRTSQPLRGAAMRVFSSWQDWPDAQRDLAKQLPASTVEALAPTISRLAAGSYLSRHHSGFPSLLGGMAPSHGSLVCK